MTLRARLSLLALAAGLASCGDQPAGGAAVTSTNAIANNATMDVVPDLPEDNSFNEANENASRPPTRVADVVPDLPPDDRARADADDDLEPADNGSADEDANAAPFPDEVTRFMVRRDGCEHFLGEEPYDEDRRAFLNRSIRDLCTGTDKRLATLRKQYAGNPDVIAALAKYENVEGDDGS